MKKLSTLTTLIHQATQATSRPEAEAGDPGWQLVDRGDINFETEIIYYDEVLIAIMASASGEKWFYQVQHSDAGRQGFTLVRITNEDAEGLLAAYDEISGGDSPDERARTRAAQQRVRQLAMGHLGGYFYPEWSTREKGGWVGHRGPSQAIKPGEISLLDVSF